MQGLGPVFFSTEERRTIKKETIQRIRDLNPLDIELLDFARQVFKQQQIAYAEEVKAVMEEWPVNNSTSGGPSRRRLRRLLSSAMAPITHA
eukprot:TRINITY_DN30004_c0_g2_i4.p1 TRINITY_DN30004_c0_g2~~TRINITY_DN30004_c0_g2_i4.p1  ORF type:complete len:102 (-),score=9.12 TRINITY_DN30004_c0_g2_i4:105-377(-)